MREKLHLLFWILAVCLFFALCSQEAMAAERTDIAKVAYVDRTRKGLALLFENFSKKGQYTFEISTGGRVILEGAAAPSKVYPLGNQFKDNTPYLLVITSKEKDTLSVLYYTGNALNKARASQLGQNIQFVWKGKKKTPYTGYLAMVCKKGAARPDQEKYVTDGKSPVLIPGAPLQNGEYSGRFIAYKNIDGTIYYGEGFVSNLIYVRIPPKVGTVTAEPNTKRIDLSWTPSLGASSYRIYTANTAAGRYRMVMDNVTATTVTLKGLKPGKKYYYKVEPVATFGTKTVAGKKSVAAGATVPVVAGRVDDLKPHLDEQNNIYLTWDKTKHAYGYHVYYKKATDPKYTKLAGLTATKLYLNNSNITENTDYEFLVYAITKKGTKKYRSDQHSNVVKFNPVADLNRILAEEVRSIRYVGRSREVYTRKKYSTRVKTAYVNFYGNRFKSPTPYLIWVNHYTQQASIFQGSAGNWNMIRTFPVATGRAWSRSPRGIFKIGRKERGWFYVNTKVLYVTHYRGENAFHTRPLYNGGGVATPTLGRPASHGCIRCKNEDARYIYKEMPAGTTVISY